MITNRERALARRLVRNSYELSEPEIDQIIHEELDGRDVDALHEEHVERDLRRKRGEDMP